MRRRSAEPRERRSEAPGVGAMLAPPPIDVAVAPRPIETQATARVTYRIVS